MPISQRVALLRDLTGSHWPARVHFNAGVLRRDGGIDAIPANLIPGAKMMTVLAVHQDGAGAARKLDAAKGALSRGSQTLLVDIFGTGSAAKPSGGRRGDHLVFHHSDEANRVQDLITSAAWLSRQGARAIRLVCGEGLEEVCRLASAVSAVPLAVEPVRPSGGKADIPGLLAAGYPGVS